MTLIACTGVLPPDGVRQGVLRPFFGCSVTYGQGVQDTQTIPYYFGQYTNGFQPYNYAYSGYGTQEMLVSLQDSTFRKGIRQRQGVGIYVFIEHHVNRVIGDLQLYTMWGENMPYFYLDGDSLKRNGSFHTGRYWTSLMYTLLNKSFTLHYFHFNMPAHLQGKHYELTGRIILASKRLFEQQYPNSPFVAVMYPGTTQRLIPFLRKYGIRYLDYSRLFDPKSPTYSMQPYDPHPNPYANRLLAKRLSEDIKRIEAEQH